MTIGVRELKANLSKCLKQVRAGASVTVTDRGRPIATIQPVKSAAADLSWVHQMVAEGKADWGGGKPMGLTPRLKLRGRGKTVSEMLIEDRQ
jgi:prevent-host-death family protein